MAKRKMVSTLEVDASHVSLLLQPKAVADLIVKALTRDTAIDYSTATPLEPAAAPERHNMRVLVVEDHPKLAGYLRTGLTENDYVVDVAADGIDAATSR